ncbi:MAG: hypothetical protein R2749_31500 [Acidimicrobiales bacterium]
MGLVRRRHFAVRGRSLLDMDDELFGSAAEALDQGTVQGHGAPGGGPRGATLRQAVRHRRHNPGRTGRG